METLTNSQSTFKLDDFPSFKMIYKQLKSFYAQYVMKKVSFWGAKEKGESLHHTEVKQTLCLSEGWRKDYVYTDAAVQGTLNVE